MKQTTMLIIMDGYGISPPSPGNAITIAGTPSLARLESAWPCAELSASGKAVGLPEGQMGNSEVGHLNMGAGRIVWQDLTRISEKIRTGDFFQNPALLQAVEHVRSNDSTLHLMGLLSDGGVHSHTEHIMALLELTARAKLPRVFIHALLDGRDVGPQTAGTYLTEMGQALAGYPHAKIASLSGRYYAMDRDNRWDRVEKAYRLYTEGEGERAASAEELLDASYKRGITDEFVLPGLVVKEGEALPVVQDGDALIFFNFRPDRAREITRAFVDEQFEHFDRGRPIERLHYVCLTEYDATIENVSIAYPPLPMKNTLGEYLSHLGKSQLRIAETEKYAHVTFFFNGGIEEPDPGEDRVLIPSPTVPTYDLKPEMSAYEITAEAVNRIRTDTYDLIVLNLANCDMVGHTGVLEAAVAAVRTVDECVGVLAEELLRRGGHVLITSDHGNADRMLTPSGEPVTAHSTAPVPLIVAGVEGIDLEQGGSLCDVAPTLLDLMELPVPQEMTGRSLLKRRSGLQTAPQPGPMQTPTSG